MDEVIQVTTTTDDKAYAESIASELIERRLAACAQIVGPIESAYRWQGKIEHQSEWVCIAKTTRGRYAEVEAAICDLHPYDMPEILVTPIIDGSKEYLNWVREAVHD